MDRQWTEQSGHLGTLVRYADDFVVMSQTRAACQQAEGRIKGILKRLRLELHPDKTRRVELSYGKQGFDFLGCHIHKRMSGPIWERSKRKLYFMNRWPSQRLVASGVPFKDGRMTKSERVKSKGNDQAERTAA